MSTVPELEPMYDSLGLYELYVSIYPLDGRTFDQVIQSRHFREWFSRALTALHVVCDCPHCGNHTAVMQ